MNLNMNTDDRDSKYEHRRKKFWLDQSYFVFEKVARLNGYEPIDEDTLHALLNYYAEELEIQFRLGKLANETQPQPSATKEKSE